jgi:hypothetical protein
MHKRTSAYPAPEHTLAIADDEFEQFLAILD